MWNMAALNLELFLPRLTHGFIYVGDAQAVGVDRPNNFNTNTTYT